MILSTNVMFDILDLGKIFVGQKGGILINTAIRAHTEGRNKKFEEDIWTLGTPDECISFDDLSDFLDKVQTSVEKWSQNGTYWLEENQVL
jgi:hypothetical protein